MQNVETLVNVRLDRIEQRLQARERLQVRRQVVEAHEEEEDSEQDAYKYDPTIVGPRRGEPQG